MKLKHKDIRRALAPAFRDIVSVSGLPKQFRPYQSETFLKGADWLEDLSGTPRAYVSHATGLGKTVEFAGMIRAAAEFRSLIIVPTKTLLTQTLRELTKWSPGLLGHLSSMKSILNRDGELIAVRGLGHSSIVITTDASFKRYAPQIKNELDPHLILRDECHWGYDAESVAAMNQFEDPVIIGFSATPDYLTNRMRGGYTPVTLENGQVLYGPRDKFAETHFQTLLDRRSLRWGIEEGYLAPMRWGLIDFEQVNLGSVRVVDGPDGPDFDKSELQELLEESWDAMCETIQRLYKQDEYGLSQRQVCATCPSVRAAQKLADTIQSLGLSAACIHGGTPDTERDVILEAYRQNEIRFLSSVRVLREGWDAPNAEVCMMLTPTASRVFYEQPIGRIERLPDDGSPKVSLVLDAHFQGKTFHPLSAPALYAPPGSEIPVGDYLINWKDWGGGGAEAAPSDPLPHSATPRIVVVDDYIQLERQEEFVTKDGFVEVDGVTWGLQTAIIERFGISQPLFRKKRGFFRTIQGRDEAGRRGVTLYAVPDVEAVCRAAMKTESPQAQKSDALLYIDGKPHATKRVAARRLGLTGEEVMKRILSCPATEARNARGALSLFYSLEDATKACADLLKKKESLPQTMANGFLSRDGEWWGTVPALGRRIGVSGMTIMNKRGDCRSINGRNVSGRECTLYALRDMKKACKGALAKKERRKKQKRKSRNK